MVANKEMCNMAKRIILVTNIFFQYFVLTITFCTHIQPSVENGLTTNYSHRFLASIPKNVPAQTTVLDLSYNSISEIWISDFRSLSKMQTLNLSHNLIRELDFNIFQCNETLEHLDLSHNHLQTASCHPITSLKHLDLSYNNFSDIPLCSEFGTMLNLKYLGLSVKKIQKSNFRFLAHLQLNTLVLDLEGLSEYGSGILVFNTKNLHIIMPSNSDFHVLSDLEINATESLDLSNIHEKHIIDLCTFLPNGNKNASLLNLTLHNIQCDWKGLMYILQTVWESTIEHLVISNGGQMDVPETFKFNHTDTSLRSLTIKQTTFTTIYSEPTPMYRLFANMNITALTISDAGLIYMLCPSQYSHFKYLDFSNNSLTDALFESCNNLTLLQSLILQRNKFKNLMGVSLMTSPMKALKYLDMSKNLLQYKDNRNKCHWGENLLKLNLSSNMLSESVFRCLPLNIQILDLHSNNILTIPKDIMELRALEEINLASNKLADLPGCLQFRSLRLLNIEMNSLTSPSSEFYHSCQSLKELKAGHNPFKCSCEIRQFINLQRKGLLKLVDWPGSYLCWYPEVLRGIRLEDFHVSDIICNTTQLITVIVIVVVAAVALVFFLCFYFHIPWYLKMIWQWTQVKRRNWKSHPEDHLNTLQFHAFVSYSEHDSEWVKNVLIPNLEKEDGSIRICQHERNFVAGKSIVENIIDCIEKSYKSIFVLSPNFVQSEWCHYELYFAHHQLFSEDGYGLILILLELIPTYVIPARYHKLKALMAKRTYLEWPKDKSKQGLFWANLRAAIQIKLPKNEEIN
ncbi:toll-like receptor 1 [Sceloporus undulatus]|uniref:toll-like receptor 1 n=1 Tax=Sceloporus undulatus TaxID=8520 RepID=UPI001C4B3E8C|nr:toll-like receptor 1 [Sceloporus undulatus]